MQPHIPRPRWAKWIMVCSLCAASPLAAQTVPATTAAFSGTLEDFPNPERGLAKLYENLTELNPAWLVSHRNSGYRLVTHRQLLSSYVNTPTLPLSFLNALNAGAALHRAHGTKMVMQFSYDNSGGGPEPNLTTILGHIAQLAPFFVANADVIAALHGGFLGTYGEWAFSTAPSIGNPTPSAAARAAVRDALLAAVPPSIQIGWRTLDDVMSWYPTPLDESQAFSGTNQARSGVHNDCFLSNKDDSGTYWRAGVPDTGRTLSNPFRAYHAQASKSTTMGGENCGDGEYKACADVLTDGPRYHWRYLRDDWGTVFHDGWKAQGCYPQIQRSLGYRFQLDAITHPGSVAPAGVADFEIALRNAGWSRIFSARKLVVTLRNKADGALIAGGGGDMRFLPAQAASSTNVVVAVPIPANAGPGDYDVFLSMPDLAPGTKDNAYFAVRFANSDDPAKSQAWEAAGFRFKTGTTLTVTGAPQADLSPPSVPDGLAAVAVSSSQINLSWNPSTDDVGVAGYRVFRAGVQIATTAAASLSDQGLSAASAYAYTVAAYDASGNVSSQSNPAAATTPAAPDTQAPSLPTGLAGTALSPSEIRLTWNPSSDNVGVAGYYVYLNDIALATTTATAFTHSGLAAGTTYNYRVSAYDSIPNHSAWTAPLSVKTTDTLAPTVPTSLVGTALSPTQIRLSWNPSTDNVAVTGYYVYLNDGALSTTTATSFTHSGLAPGTTYSYRVSAYDAAPNHSAWTAQPVSIRTPPADTQAPTVPTGLTGTALSSSRIRLTWNPSTDDVGVIGYYVYVNDVALATTAGTAFTHSGLAPGTSYNYRVSAYDAVPNHSAWTANPVSVRTRPRRVVHSDFNGDGRSDLLWRNRTSGEDAIWMMNGASISVNAGLAPSDPHWSVFGIGDFDADGKADILWRHGVSGEFSIWFMNGATILSRPVFGAVADPNWRIAGVGDFNGDGRADILWHNDATGSNTIWLMNGTATVGGATNFAVEPDLDWAVARVADFDGDGKADILWRHGVSGEFSIWFMNGATILSRPVFGAVADPNWRIAGVGDFNGDGRADILWHNDATGSNTIWLMNGTAIVGGATNFAVEPDLDWAVAGVADFDGDGKADILWRHRATGSNTIWFMSGASILSRTASAPVTDADWGVVGSR